MQQHSAFIVNNPRQGKRMEGSHLALSNDGSSKNKVQPSKSKKDMRPLSGGIQKAVKHNEGRSRI